MAGWGYALLTLAHSLRARQLIFLFLNGLRTLLVPKDSLRERKTAGLYPIFPLPESPSGGPSGTRYSSLHLASRSFF